MCSRVAENAASATGDSGRREVWPALVFCEFARRRSPSNYELKLLLIMLYSRVGAWGAVTMLWEELAVKNIQLNTMVRRCLYACRSASCCRPGTLETVASIACV